MKSISVIQSTIDDEKAMNTIINGLLNKKLIACAQVCKIRSHYWWNQSIEYTSEFSIVLKLPKGNVEQVVKYIKQNHSYDVPEIILEEKQTTDSYYNYLNEVCVKG